MKAECRMSLRNYGLAASSAEVDQLFDTWNDDKDGALDIGEFKKALMRAMDAAKEFEVACQSDPNLERARALRRKAAAVQEAARAVEEADSLEAEFEKLVKSIDASADLELGRLLYKRRIKPGAMVVLWSAATGGCSQ